MVTGRLPFSGDTVTEVLTQIIRDRAEEPSRIVPRLSPEVAAIIHRLLEKDREKRFANAAEVSHALQHAASRASDLAPTARADAASIPTVVTRPKVRSPRRYGWLVAVMTVLVAAVAGVIVMQQRRSGAPVSVAAAAPATTNAAPPPGTAVEVMTDDTTATATAAATATEIADATIIETTSSAAPVATAVATPRPAATTAPPPVATAAPPPIDGRKTLAMKAYNEGLQLMSKGRTRAAALAFETALGADNTHGGAHLRLAETLYVLGRKEEARGHFERALELTSSLTAKEQELAAIGKALAANDLALAQQLGESFAAKYPNDPELQALQAGLAEATSAPSSRPHQRRRPFRP
jgi:Tfp pilus assembly protein PilF